MRFLGSFGHAFAGLVHVASHEKHMRFHLAAAIAVATAGLFLELSAIEWSLLLLCMGGTLAMECMNTAIERIADRVCAEQDPLIKQCKDSAAAGVLMFAAASALVGAIIFAPKLLAFMQ